ncbi:MAG TPA: N-(5'-phosphoribosyl)anthranilate isomerase [Clostridiales bacterium]|nr:N-(5'-phosphoribosyl)anthranilate isomerase [Clostridiales bacterium]
MVKIKICGLSRECDIDFANEAKLDYVGFVFANSRRKITKEQAYILKKKLNSDIKTVGVFVNEDINFILELLNENIIDIIQLHGHEDEKYMLELKRKTDNPIIKAITVDKKDFISNFSTTFADYLLLDSGAGGTGVKFDWNLLDKEIKKPFFLAGGIDAENVEQAIKLINPFAIDTSSGVETNGYKDRYKILDIVRRVKV